MSEAKFTVRNSRDLGRDPKTVSDESILYEFVSLTTDDRLGVQLNPDGKFTVGTWDEDGVWVDLKIMESAEFGHLHVAALNKYRDE